MTEMWPSARVKAGSDPARKACDIAFALAYRYSRGHDLVEEMVASMFWPSGKNRLEMKLEKVKLPTFGKEDGVFFFPVL